MASFSVVNNVSASNAQANLTQTISVLRKALGESPREHRYIVTVPGRGYRFVCDARESALSQRRHAVRTGVVVEPDTTEGSREPGQHFPEVVVLLRERYDHGVVDTCLLHRNEETLGEFLAVGLGHRGVGRSRVFRPMRPEQVQMGIDDLRHAGGLLDVGLR